VKISMHEIFIKIIWLPLKLTGFLLYTANWTCSIKALQSFTPVALKAECSRICELCSIQPSYKSSYFPWTCQIWKLTEHWHLIKLGQHGTKCHDRLSVVKELETDGPFQRWFVRLLSTELACR